MRGAGRWAGAVSGVMLVGGLAWSVPDVWRFRPRTGGAPGRPEEARGVLHVHSDRSDGAGSPAAIARAAREAGLDFVVLTDHQDFEGLGEDRYEEGVLLLAGVEISSRGGHVVALDIPDPDFRFDGETASVLDDVRDLGGFSVAAHPFSWHRERNWEEMDVAGFDALEVVNWAEDFRPLSMATAAGLVSAVVNPRYGLLRLLGPPSRARPWWDRLTGERPVVGVAAADAHGGLRLSPSYHFPFPEYRLALPLWTNHVLLDRPLSGREVDDHHGVLEALRSGRLYLAMDGLADAAGFRFEAAGGVPMGGSLPLAVPVRLEVESPRLPAETVLLRNGQEVARGTARRLTYTAREAGAYRAEVFWRGPGSPADPSIPWILSNPIYLGVPTRSWSRADRTPIPGDGVLWEDFEGGVPSDWRIGSDRWSEMSELSIEDAEGAEYSSASLSLAFRMGNLVLEGERSYAALVIPAPSEIGEARGLSFFCRASGDYRFDVQVRDRNPRSGDGVESWRASVKTSTAWQPVFVPFDRLMSYHPQSDGRLDLDEVDALAFYLDTATVRPGVAGRIWIDRLRWHPR